MKISEAGHEDADLRQEALLAVGWAAGAFVVNHDNNLDTKEHFVAYEELPFEPRKRHSKELISSFIHSFVRSFIDSLLDARKYARLIV